MDNTDLLSNGQVAPTITGFCNANWGPQDASIPSTSQPLHQISQAETRSICGHVLTLGGAPVLWKCHRENRGSRSSCEAEVKATDECTKSVQVFRHFLGKMGLITLTQSTTIYHMNMREN